MKSSAFTSEATFPWFKVWLFICIGQSAMWSLYLLGPDKGLGSIWMIYRYLLDKVFFHNITGPDGLYGYGRDSLEAEYGTLLVHWCNVPAQLLAILQVVPSFRNTHWDFHKKNGWLIVCLTLVGCVAGMFLAHGDRYATSHHSLWAFRAMGSWAIACLLIGILKVYQKQYTAHQLWMSRYFGVMAISSIGLRVLQMSTLWWTPDVNTMGYFSTFYVWTTPIMGFIWGSYSVQEPTKTHQN